MKQVEKVVNPLCGKRFKRIREDSGFNQRDFAASLDVAPSTVSEVEAGNSAPGYSLLMKANEVYKANPNYILLGIGEPYLRTNAVNPDEFDFGAEHEEVQELLSKMARSPILRFAVVAFGDKFLHSNKDVIEMDIAVHAKRKTFEKEPRRRVRKNDNKE